VTVFIQISLFSKKCFNIEFESTRLDFGIDLDDFVVPTGSSSLGSSGSLTVHQQQESQQSLTKMTTTPAATASVNRRQKIYGNLVCSVQSTSQKFKLFQTKTDDDSDRGMRRISYLKAQAGNPLDSTRVGHHHGSRNGCDGHHHDAHQQRTHS
jgi:hypothetical protein